jgi:RNA polymerase sigma-70 factor (ECF subfamily)
MDLVSRPDDVAGTAGEVVSGPGIAAPAGQDVAPAAAALTDDATLMLRYRAGDARAFEILYERHKGPLYRYLQRMCRSRETANDLFQEVWGKVIASRERYEVRAQFNTYLFRIAHNCAVDHFRRASRPQDRYAQDVEDVAAQIAGAVHERPDAELAHAQLQAAFRRALDQLPAEQRDVFVLYEETGLSLEEIGKVTGVAMETAKSRLRYALTKLRAALRQHEQPGLEPSMPT